LCPASDSSAQAAESTLSEAVEVAAAHYLARLHPINRIGFEDVPRAFDTSPADTTILPARRSYGHIQKLVDALKARHIPLGSKLICGEGAAGACVDLVVRIGVPVVGDDSATVWTFTYAVREMEELDRQLLLRMVGGVWQVARVLELRRTSTRGSENGLVRWGQESVGAQSDPPLGSVIKAVDRTALDFCIGDRHGVAPYW